MSRSLSYSVVILGAILVGTGGSGCALDDRQSNRGKNESNVITLNGITLNGLGSNGITLNGITLNGITLNGITLNGITLNGITLNGITLNGITLNGITLNGITLNGLHFGSFNESGTGLAGVALDGLELDQLSYGVAPMDEATIDSVDALLEHAVACALSEGSCVTIHGNGGAVSRCGESGLAPEWATGSLDLDNAGAVADCIYERSSGTEVTHEPVDHANFKKIIGYLASCALPKGQSITVADLDGSDLVYTGALGLAPWWQHQGLSPAPAGAADIGERRVSACIASRVNSLGQTVQLSLRGTTSRVRVTEGELDLYSKLEGAYWGNLFAEAPALHACNEWLGAAERAPGRDCAYNGGCGFVLHGKCDYACAGTDDEDSAYTVCLGEAETVTVFLPEY